MKFVALALAVLLAVGEFKKQSFQNPGIRCTCLTFFFSTVTLGSQAASLQADAPSQLAQIRSAIDVYMTQAKDGAIKALDQLDGTQYEEMK